MRFNFLYINLFVFCLFAALLSGCGVPVPKGPTPPPGMPLTKLSVGQYPQFFDSRGFEGLAPSMDQSLVYFRRVPSSRKYTYGKDSFDAAHMIRSMETFKTLLAENLSPDELDARIKKEFWVYASVGNAQGKVLFTGYYEPTYKGSLEPDDTYVYPVYSKPLDLLQIDLSLFSDKYKGHKRLTARVNPQSRQVVPYFSRQEINGISDFKSQAPPVAWLENRVDRFFLEIQGSGRVALKQGGELRVHYAGSNGKAYRSVGRYLIDKKEIAKENMSMQAIREWLEKNPERMDEVLHHNQSFVFFKAGEGGPFGSINVAVTPLRSIATDQKLFPNGGLCFAQAALPDPYALEPLAQWKQASLFVLNQDTGGAIKGPARADLFFGNGAYAEFTAGHMNVYGQLYFLVLKP
ncbi:MAG: MltA domain-containing protein [Proteobacteria bacterium]|nr:murein transglycosylase [Desulfobacula sp.]MBU3951687.1 MltA domain-containing protein [Pseudomonadota bacterium]MBU4132383.1 MltA domain-containing protein [Pseudomonadota bacterium]